MKLLVEHDEQGNIKSVIARPRESAAQFHLSFEPQTGYQVSMVEAPHVADDHDYDHLREVLTHWRVEGYRERQRLVRRSEETERPVRSENQGKHSPRY